MAVYIHESRLHKEPLATNEFGLVLPPTWESCMGDDCRFSPLGEECRPNVNHLEFDILNRSFAGPLKGDFRRLPYLTVWMHWCRHFEFHERHEQSSPMPSDEVMTAVIDEAAILKAIDVAAANLRNAEFNIAFNDPASLDGHVDMGMLLERRMQFSEERAALVRKTREFEVIPSRLVTGALILSAPLEARRRIDLDPEHQYAITANVAEPKSSKKRFKPKFYPRVLDLLPGTSVTELAEAA